MTINPARTIVLCLDIDDTLINYHTGELNGTLSMWIDCLTRLQLYCKAVQFDFIVQIITSKERLDHYVDKVMRYFSPFLHLLTKEGDIWHWPNQINYYVMHHLPKTQIKRLAKSSEHAFLTEEVPSLLLPPIHFANNRIHHFTLSSKSRVMQTISEHFYEPIPPQYMYLLDDNEHNGLDLKRCGKPFNFVSFNALSNQQMAKPLRNQLCHSILNLLEHKIKHQLSNWSIEAIMRINMQAGRFVSARTVIKDLDFERKLLVFRKEADLQFKIQQERSSPEAEDIAALSQSLYCALVKEKIDFLSMANEDPKTTKNFIKQCTTLVCYSIYQFEHAYIFLKPSRYLPIKNTIQAIQLDDFILFLYNKSQDQESGDEHRLVQTYKALYKQLIDEKINFMVSEDDIQSATHQLFQRCYQALESADAILLHSQRGRFEQCFNFFATENSYHRKRNEFLFNLNHFEYINNITQASL